MTNDPLPSAPPPSEDRQGRPATEPPQAIKTAVTIVWAVLALALLSTILTFVYLDELVSAAAGPDLTSAQESAARTGAIVGSIVGFLLFGALWAILAIFLRKGANWARIVLTILAVLGLVFGAFGLLAGQPATLLVLGVVQLALYAALVYFMWRRESTAYINAPQAG